MDGPETDQQAGDDVAGLRARLAAAEAELVRMRQALSGSGAATWEWDLATGESAMSDAWYRLLGLEPGALPRHADSWADRVHPDDRDRVWSALADHTDGRAPAYEAEYRILTRDRGWRWIQARGRVTGRGPDGRALRMSGTLVDVHERRMVQEALASERDRVVQVIAQMQDGVLLFDADLRIVEVNARALELLGRPREDVVGRTSPFPWIPGDDEASARARRRAFLTAGRGEWERALVRADGSELTALVTAALLPGGGSVLTVKDISERVRVERGREVLSRLAHLVAAGAELQEVLDRVAAEALGVVGGESCGILRFTGDGWAEMHARAGLAHRLGLRRVMVAASRGEPLLSDPAPIASEGQALIAEDDRGERRTVHLPAAAMTGLTVRGQAWGMIAVGGAPVGGAAADATLASLRRLADLAELAIGGAEARAELARQAMTDGLTGLLNHRAFHDRLEQEAARAARHERPLGLCLLDVDRLKDVNDREGHLRGDEVLQAVAELLLECARRGDTLARVGGDEFAWLMPEADAAEAGRAARRACAATARPRPVTLSAGVAALARGEAPRDLFRRADAALYRDKAAKRPRP